MDYQYFRWGARLRASTIHLLISGVVALLSALLVFGVWFPFPYGKLAGGLDLFILLISVDLIIGPLVTLVVFNQDKSRAELRRDLAFVGLFQLLALSYGLWIMASARPIHLAFEIDRFRVVHAVDVPTELSERSPKAVQAFPLFGPDVIGLRDFKNQEEKAELTLAALQGLQLSFHPDLWQPYDKSRKDVLKAGKPINELRKRFPTHAASIDAALAESRVADDDALFVPLAARKDFWTVLIDARNADVIGFVPVDSF